MGVDFMRKAAPSYRKGLDQRRIELATPTLFTQQPISASRVYAARLRAGETLDYGDQVCVRLNDLRQVLVLRGISVIGMFSNPPTDLVDALVRSHDEGCGIVEAFHGVASIAEIRVC